MLTAARSERDGGRDVVAGLIDESTPELDLDNGVAISLAERFGHEEAHADPAACSATAALEAIAERFGS